MSLLEQYERRYQLKRDFWDIVQAMLWGCVGCQLVLTLWLLFGLPWPS